MKKNEIISTILEHVKKAIIGVIVGAFSMVPFACVDNLKELMSVESYDIGDKRSLPDYKRTLLSHLKKYFMYLIGAMVGIIIFFIVPWETKINSNESTFTSYYTYLADYYSGALHLELLTFIVGSLVYEIYKYTQIRKRVGGVETSIGAGIVMIAISLLMFFLLPGSFESINALSYIVFFLIAIVGTIITSYLGISIGTLLFFSTFYLQFADLINGALRVGENVGIAIIFIVGCLIGYALSTALGLINNPLKREKIGARIGLLIAGIIAVVTKIKEPYFYEDSLSVLAQQITMGSSAIAGLLVSVGLTIHGYKYFNKAEMREGEKK